MAGIAVLALAMHAGPALSAGGKLHSTSAHSTRLILLGTAGGPNELLNRSQPASLLVVDGTPYLIDAGAGVTRQITRAGFKAGQVRALFITHHHVDHNAGLEPLISLTWFGRNFFSRTAPPEQIYGPPATKYLVQKSLEFLSVSERIFKAGIDLLPAAPMFQAHDIDHDGLVYQDDKVRVTAAENTHFHFKSGSPETGSDISYSYRFDTASGSVVFTGDTGPSDAVTRLAKGTDILVSEVCRPPPDGWEALTAASGKRKSVPALPPGELKQLEYHMANEHLLPEEVGKMAARAQVKVVVLTHIILGNEPDPYYTTGVKRYFSGPVIAGADMFEYDLSGSAPGQVGATRISR